MNKQVEHLLQRDVPLGPLTWFGTGGNARLFAQPRTAHEFSQLLTYAMHEQLSVFVLGQGANVLVSDDGFAGLLIKPALGEISFDHQANTVTVGSGFCFQDLIQACLDNGFSGLEEFSGIPGTVGGAVYINMHYFNFLLSQFVVRATVIDRTTGHVQQVTPDWFAFAYDYSTLCEQNHYLVDATFALKPASPLEIAFARGRRTEIIRHRNSRYPTARTCGSFFRNFLADEVPFLVNGKKLLFVAYYLDRLGIKGELRVGNAVVSHQHANMLVTLPGATSSDVVALARNMQQRVFDAYGIVPQSECQFIGFKDSPLLQVPRAQEQEVAATCL